MTDDMEMTIDIREGRVVQEFKENVKRVAYDPDNAMEVAIFIAELANEIMGTEHVPGKHMGSALKDELIERTRMKLTQRIAIVLGTLRKDVKKTNGQAAQEIVDICLSEVF